MHKIEKNILSTKLAIVLSIASITACGGGGGDSAAPIVVNSVPIANAGPIQNILVGALVTLDGSASDANGDTLTYSWTLTKPAGSAAQLSSSTTPKPTFTVDLPGNYTGALTVNDGKVNSNIATVILTATVVNAAPVANAGSAQNVITNSLVTLDGSSSSDANGDQIAYNWSITGKPTGSMAALALGTSAKPTFLADLPGAYSVSLIVNDGKVSSNTATVSITAANANVVPVANAGTTQNVTSNTLVTLDGSASSDANGDTLSYLWTLVSKPSGSGAVFSSATTVKPSFTADAAGTYVASLVVNDGKVSSAPSTVSVTAAVANSAPVANAGTAENVTAGSLVTLNGSNSSDANGDALTYSWTLTSKPAGSSAVLNNATSAMPTVIADVAGTYVASLVVNDGKVSSNTSTASIIAVRQPITLYEREFNDDYVNATRFNLGDTVEGSLSSENDVDWFEIPIETGGMVSVTFDASSMNFGLFNVYWYAPDMMVMSGRNIGGGSGSSPDQMKHTYSFPAFQKGSYKARVQPSSSSLYNGGGYKIKVVPQP